MQPIAIVLLNYNSWSDTIECLESVLKLDYDNFKIYLVDNSNDNISWDKINDWAKGNIPINDSSYPDLVNPIEKKPLKFSAYLEGEPIDESGQDLILIRAKQNNGFAAGNNIALKQVIKQDVYDYVWLLNNDTVVPKNSLKSLTNHLNSSKAKIGILGSALVYYSNPPILQGIGGNYNKWFGTSKPINNGKNINNIKTHSKIDYPIGAAMFVTKQFLKDVGLLNEEYFLYYEEMDWVLRGRKYGYKVDYSSHSVVYHKVGASIGTGKALERSEFSDYYSLKNRIKFVKKYYPLFLPTTYLGFLIVIFNRLRRKQFEFAKNAFKIMLNIKVDKFSRSE